MKEELFMGYGCEIELDEDFKKNLISKNLTPMQKKAYEQYKGRGLEIAMITYNSGESYKTYLYSKSINENLFLKLDLFLEDYATNISKLDLIKY